MLTLSVWLSNGASRPTPSGTRPSDSPLAYAAYDQAIKRLTVLVVLTSQRDPGESHFARLADFLEELPWSASEAGRCHELLQLAALHSHRREWSRAHARLMQLVRLVLGKRSEAADSCLLC